MEFRILGPFEVLDERGPVALGGTKPRAVLAALLMHPNEPVSAERLALAVWGEDAPEGAVKTVQVHVSRLRKALGDVDVLATTPAGYRLRVRPGELDAERFERLVDEGRNLLASGHPEEAAAVLRDALTLWRGAPLAELAFEPFAQTEIARLEEERLAAIEARVEADLAAGHEAELIGELQHLVAEHPTRERLAGQLMLALYRCGRQADALKAFAEVRRVLVADVGVEPGPELRRLQDAILHHDPALAPEAAPDLPQELDASTAPALEGRDEELAWLRGRWEQARSGAGVLVTLIGERGIGKTRLLAELTGEAHAGRAVVIYAAGAGPADAVLAGVQRLAEATRPTLLVVDDADRAGPDVLAALDDLARAIVRVPVLAVVAGRDGELLAGLGAEGSLLLRPLSVDAVSAIAAGYAPGHAADDVPADWLLEASAGVPLRVHELAGQWARREAARRVGVAAGRAAAGRAELRTMEAELQGGVVDLQTAREHVALLSEGDQPVVCPFKGLASFDVADAQYFFGREQLVAELVARLVGAPLLGVVGPSGSGKSSVLRAGLLPALAGGVLPESEQRTQVLIRPGEHPLEELRAAVTGLGHDRMVIAVDQFEETFTVCRDEDERAAFIAALVRAARDPDHQSIVLVAIRADYYGRCAAYPELSSLLAANHVLVRTMAPDELRRAIELPARRAGLRVDPELTDALVEDTKGEPGALPLLSTALLELWQHRRGRRLRHADYEHTGGVRGAVARLAEGAFSRLDDAQRDVARGVFMRLAAEGEEGTVERRRVPLAELETGGNGDVPSVVSSLADERLLTISSGTAEVAHEALLREWPRLRGWIEDDREGLRIHRRLTIAAQEWDSLKRDEDALYRGARLSEAVEWRSTRNPTLNPIERDFLAASDARVRHERAARRRRIQLAFAGLAAALAAISVVAILALHQRGEARNQRDIAVSRGLAASATNLLSADPSLSLSLAMRALGVAKTDEAAAVLRQATLGLRELAIFPLRKGWANSARFSPDGRRAVTAGTDGRVLVWDLVHRRLLATLRKGGSQVYVASFSPDGRSVAIATEDGAVSATGLTRVRWRTVLRARGGVALSVAFSPDGRRVVAAFADGTVRLGNLTGGAQRILRGHRGVVFGAAFSPNAKRILSWGEDRTLRIWDSASSSQLRVLRGHDDAVPSAAFDASGRRIVSAGYDNTIRVWDAQNGEQLRRFDANYVPFVADFSPDGRRIVTGARDGAVRILDAFDPHAPALAVLRGHGAYVVDARFSPDGSRVLSAGQDGTVRLWDPGAPVVLRAHVADATFSPDGRRVITAGDDGVVRFWSAAGGPVQRRLVASRGSLSALGVAPNGRLLATGDHHGGVAIWRLGARTVPLRLPAGRHQMSSLAFSNDSRRLASASADGRVLLWSLPSTRPMVVAHVRQPLHEASFSPDGRRIVVAGEGGLLTIYDITNAPRAVVRLPGHRGAVYSAAFSPDGRTVASGGADGTIRVWTASGRALVVMHGHDGPVNSVAFRPDGRRIVSASSDDTVRVWDPARTEALVVLRQSTRDAETAEFDRAGRRVLSSDIDGTAWITPCEVCGSRAEVLALASARVERQLTPDERQRYLASIQ